MKRILLIDDDLYIRELYQELLSDNGFEVVAVRNADEGLSNALQGGFDLILLDVLMPGKNGVEFLKEYKTKTPQKPNGPILMLSALKEEPVIKSSLSEGAVGYLIKTELTPDQVIQEINNYISPPQQ